MGRKAQIIAMFVVAFAVFAVCASAHHSFGAVFDASKPVELKGTVTSVERINPHGWIHIDVKKTDGTIESWAVETVAPAALARRGLKMDAIVGLEVNVKGYRSRDGSTTANGNVITLPDGRALSLATSADATDKPPE